MFFYVNVKIRFLFNTIKQKALVTTLYMWTKMIKFVMLATNQNDNNNFKKENP